MKKLYEKNELNFSLIIIGAYVILFSLSDMLSDKIGTAKLVTAPLALIFSSVLFVFIKKNRLGEKYGLISPRFGKEKYLSFIVFLFMISVNLWGGITLEYSVAETAAYIITMLFVGLIEEIIFRGFLFKAIYSVNPKLSILISSVTFGIGHVVNLLNGAQLIPTLLQIVYATAAGYIFTVVFIKSKSLLPCIVTHSLVNALSVFSQEADGTLSTVIFTVILIASAVVFKLRFGDCERA